jgi:diketogulonate reductase-like aldo/keto reductase
MYGNGRSEELIGEAIKGRRTEAFLVSKVLPQNASRKGTIAACERSLRRLKTDRLDLYLLHWRGSVPFSETLSAFVYLQQKGLIRHFGVSNLDLKELQEWWELDGGSATATNQLLYNLSRRSIEWDLLPWLRKRRVPVMAYSPIERARLLRDPKLLAFAKRYDLTVAQVALAWFLKDEDIIVIPKTSRPERLKENIGALSIRLSTEQLAELDTLFPPPRKAVPLEML